VYGFGNVTHCICLELLRLLSLEVKTLEGKNN